MDKIENEIKQFYEIGLPINKTRKEMKNKGDAYQKIEKAIFNIFPSFSRADIYKSLAFIVYLNGMTLSSPKLKVSNLC